MTANIVPSGLVPLELAQPLAVRLFKAIGSSQLGQVSVSTADFSEVASEAWRDGCLRAGWPDTPLSAAPMRLTPIFVDGSDSLCAGFSLELRLPDGQAQQRYFTFHCLRHVAERAIARLLDVGGLNVGESCLFEVTVDPQQPRSVPPTEPGVIINVALLNPVLVHLTASLRQLLERAVPVALLDEEVFPVFYTEAAFARSEACARRGAETQVESGGALFGSLAACPETGEFCAIIQDAVEVQEADEKRFSLAYSGRSWLSLQQIQQARRAAFPSRASRLLGQSHGHPFKPNDGKQCADCEKRAVCTLSSAWVSQDDQLWHRAVFARQPWALCHIFGLTARGEPVHQMFGLKDGRLQARGFYLLPEFPIE